MFSLSIPFWRYAAVNLATAWREYCKHIDGIVGKTLSLLDEDTNVNTIGVYRNFRLGPPINSTLKKQDDGIMNQARLY